MNIYLSLCFFGGRNGKFAAEKFAPFRNSPQISLFAMKQS